MKDKWIEQAIEIVKHKGVCRRGDPCGNCPLLSEIETCMRTEVYQRALQYLDERKRLSDIMEYII